MIRFGFHCSIAGGFARAVEEAHATGCRAMQIFSRNPRGWAAPRPIDPVASADLQAALVRHDISPLVVHMPYLPNLASPVDDLYERSVSVLREELARAAELGAAYLVVHLGHRAASSEEEACIRVAGAVDCAIAASPGAPVVLLENAAGQGTEIGSRFEQLGTIIRNLSAATRVGVCLDTAHAWGAGYDLATADGVAETFAVFDECIGWERLRLVHFNDSKAARGSLVDRHEHIGKGSIGPEGLRLLINHPRLSHLPFIMETPRKSQQDDCENLKAANDLILKGEKFFKSS